MAKTLPDQIKPSVGSNVDAVRRRRRGRQQGFLKKEGPSWAGYWWEWDQTKQEWKKRHKVICPRFDSKGRKIEEAEARRHFNEMVLDDLEDHNVHCPYSIVSVREYWEKHFRPSLKRLRPRGRQHYHTMIEGHVLPALGGESLRDVKLINVQHLIYEKQDEYSPQTLTHLRNVVSALFKHARKMQMYKGPLPTEGLELPEMKRVKKRPLEPDQLQKFLMAFKGFSPIHELLLTLAILGPRIGEASGLRWMRLNLTGGVKYQEDIAFGPLTALIQDNWVPTTKKFLGPEGMTYGETKSQAGLRLVPLPRVLVKALGDWRQRTEFPEDGDHVFPTKKGKPFDHHNQGQKVLKPMAKQLGMEWVSWHNFRHTANTAGGVVGMTVTERQGVFGWSTDRMALHYDHSNLERMRDGVEKIAEYLLGRGQ
jgi:integrase